MRATLTLMIFGMSVAVAGATDTELAQHLGDVIASSDACGFEIDQDALGAFIEKNVSADDMEFASSLDSEVYVNKLNIKRMSETEKVAWCTQIRRVAKAYRLSK